MPPNPLCQYSDLPVRLVCVYFLQVLTTYCSVQNSVKKSTCQSLWARCNCSVHCYGTPCVAFFSPLYSSIKIRSFETPTLPPKSSDFHTPPHHPRTVFFSNRRNSNFSNASQRRRGTFFLKITRLSAGFSPPSTKVRRVRLSWMCAA